MKLGTSPITGTIFCGKTKKNGKYEEWIGKKEDLTDNAISCVAEHMNYLLKSTEGDTRWEFTWKNFGKLSFLNKKGLEDLSKSKYCEWTEDFKTFTHETSCKNSFEALDDLCKEFKNCPYCGKNIKFIPSD